MAIIKFEECFLRNTEEFISVEDLQKIHDKGNRDYERYYLGNFYCPECFVAQLSFHPNAQTPHFRSNGLHEEDCSFNYEPASKKQMEAYCSDQGNQDAINRKLKSCLDLLARCSQQHSEMNSKFNKEKKPENPNYFTVDIGTERRSIRRKKLSVSLRENDYDVPMIFYGTVLLEWDLRNKEMKFLRIRNATTKAYVCSLSVSNNIYLHIEEGMKFDGKKICDVAFLSQMEKKENFNNCRIKYSTELVIKVKKDE